MKHTHVKDARPGSGPQWDLLLLGEGEVPAREVIELLAAKGYQGYLSVEWEKKWQPQLADPEVAFPSSAERCEGIWPSPDRLARVPR